MQPEQLNQEWAIPDRIDFDTDPHGLVVARVTTPAASGRVYLHGAHVAAYQPTGQPPLLFMSRASQFAQGQPIRGGVPLCFPWFGPKPDDPDAPMHGLVRLRAWDVAGTTAVDDQTVELDLRLVHDDPATPFWPDPFELRYRVRIGPELALWLTVRNTGTNAFTFTQALHTYLAVADARRISITGLAGARYISKTQGMQPQTQPDEPIRITGETDRVYLDTESDCVVHDPGHGRRVRIAKSGSRSTVVWNPWVDKAKAMPDFADDEWPGMVCVETANALDNAVTLAPGAEHAIGATIRAEPA